LIDTPTYKTFIPELVELLLAAKSAGKKTYIFGNGASAAVASHIANDLTKAAEVPALTIHDPAVLTCFGNDFGYENWIAKAIGYYAGEGDVAIMISSSGTSANIVNAIDVAKDKNLKIVFLSGPNPNANAVAKADLHASVNSRIYNVIECIHMILLTAAIDIINPVMLPETAS
jgi:D-sedoheptulose 7-phosphate isomerase